MTSDAAQPMRNTGAPGRNAYAELLRDTRGLRREQQQAREAWFARLASDKKEETLFELEMLLKGLACFGNPRNHLLCQASDVGFLLDFQAEADKLVASPATDRVFFADRRL